jgi:hypothetical protein
LVVKKGFEDPRYFLSMPTPVSKRKSGHTFQASPDRIVLPILVHDYLPGRDVQPTP